MHGSCWLLAALWVCTSLLSLSDPLLFLDPAIYVLTTSNISVLTQWDPLKPLPGLDLSQLSLCFPGPSPSAHPSGQPSEPTSRNLALSSHPPDVPLSFLPPASLLLSFSFLFHLCFKPARIPNSIREPYSDICLPAFTEIAHTQLQIIKISRTILNTVGALTKWRALREMWFSHFLISPSQQPHEVPSACQFHRRGNRLGEDDFLSWPSWASSVDVWP